LLSAISGGQWPQARLAGTRKWTSDDQCQLCQAAVGTLEHRHSCATTSPAEGWQRADDEACAFLDALEPNRRRVLCTRGVAAVVIKVPPAIGHDTFTWLVQPPDDVDPIGWTWFIDGSLMDEARVFARRAGFAIVVVDEKGSLVGCGRGRPPQWLTTAAGAEAWAFWTVVRLNPFLPRVVTDCLEVLQTLAGGRSEALVGTRRLARVWRLIFDALDGGAGAPESMVRWMPAHRTGGAIGMALKSDGTKITFTEWRANRLVDVLAKTAAAFDRVPPSTLAKVKAAGRAVEHSLAKLGTITHACNNHVVDVVRPDGTLGHRKLRDSAPEKRSARRGRPMVVARPVLAPAALPTAAAETLAVTEWQAPHWHEGHASRAACATRKRRREEQEQVSRLVSQMSLAPAAGDSASVRMARLAERIRRGGMAA
jgi:hypothetical protein